MNLDNIDSHHDDNRKKTSGTKRKLEDDEEDVDVVPPLKKRKLNREQKEEKYDEYHWHSLGDEAHDIDPEQALSTDEILRKMERLLYRLVKSFKTKQEHIKCIKLLQKIVKNLILHPMDQDHHKNPSKYRKLNLENSKLNAHVFKYDTTLDLLRLIGFEERDSCLILSECNENMIVFEAFLVKISNYQETKNSNNAESTSTQPQTDEPLLTQINEWLSNTGIPPKTEQCSKSQFYLVLLLLIEVENMDKNHKIDFLLLFNFLQNVSQFKAFPFNKFGENIFKLTTDHISKLLNEKTDFDTDKLIQIFDALFTEDTTAIIAKFRQNASQLDIAQTMRKIQKCASETKGEKKQEEWNRKQFAVGNRIDCCDAWGKWCVSQIVRHKKAADEEKEAVYVHYMGWNTKYDEWIFIDTDGDIFCGCSDRCKNMKDNQHRIAMEKTQTVYANRNIQYKIKNMGELLQYINKEYEAPRGRNRSGMGAQRYAMAIINGPGGNLNKFKMWDEQKQYDRFHHSHYDWWMFPNDRNSGGKGRTYALFQTDIDELLQVDGYLENYKLGTKLVLKSWGWDIDKRCFIEDGTATGDQRWTGYNVRLLKMLYSAIILKQWDVYESVYHFCIGLLKKGRQFRSEPMIYEYLGLEKPTYVSRYRW